VKEENGGERGVQPLNIVDNSTSPLQTLYWLLRTSVLERGPWAFTARLFFVVNGILAIEIVNVKRKVKTKEPDAENLAKIWQVCKGMLDWSAKHLRKIAPLLSAKHPGMDCETCQI